MERRIFKAISWEIASNTICLLIAYAEFRSFGSCLKFTAICIGLKIGLYCVHEGFWEGK